MSKRLVMTSLVAIAIAGGTAAAGLAMASDPTDPTLKNTSARYEAGTLTFTTDASDDSGIRGVKVLAWPASSKLDPTEKELRSAEAAACERTDDDTSRCTYTLSATKEEAATQPEGTWYVTTLTESVDDTTTFTPRAATFTVPTR